MEIFQVLAALFTLTALCSYANHRWIRLPTTVGVMLLALVFSLLLIVLELLGLPFREPARKVVEQIDFDRTVLHGMLSFLLFAGALHINLNSLARRKWTIGILATLGVFLSTFLVGTLSFFAARLAGWEIPFLTCLVFGALISPTDPIAVMGLLRSAGAPKDVETVITGESLFNDGVGVVVFLAVLALAAGGEGVTAGKVSLLLLEEAAGGVLFGLLTGGVTFFLLRSVDCYQVEILLTLALVTAGYALAELIHVSAPISTVVAGLLIGNHGRVFAMSEKTRRNIDTFWELVDEILNALLFVLIGLEVLALVFRTPFFLAGTTAVLLVLLSRVLSVWGPIAVLRKFRPFPKGTVSILTWGGLRGGISVAMALSLPEGPHRNLLLSSTYLVVVFSILVQGTTMPGLVRLFHGREEGEPPARR